MSIAMMKVGAVGRTLIEKNEGIVLHAYRDIVGVLTIGYGHTLGVRLGQTITQAEADQMLSDDLNAVYGPQVFALLASSPTSQAQFDAMVSLAYNVGVGDWLHGRIDRHDAGGFEDSSVLKHHLRGEYQAAATSFALWNKAGGRVLAALTRRRAEEASLYLSAPLPIIVPESVSMSEVHPDLRIGAAGASVAELQRRLTALGFPCGAIDAAFGARTDEAAERFQKAHKIWPGVTVAGSTWNALAQAEADKGSST